MTARIRDRLAALESVRPTPQQPQMPKHERDRRFAAATADIPDDQLSQTVREMMDARSSTSTTTGGPQ